MKTCPYCAEAIQDAAVVCRFCGKAIVPVEGTASLERAVNDHVAAGFVVASRGDQSAVLIKARRANHALHLVLSVLTMGLWLFVWLFAILGQSEHRRTLFLADDNSLRYRDGLGPDHPYGTAP